MILCLTALRILVNVFSICVRASTMCKLTLSEMDRTMDILHYFRICGNSIILPSSRHMVEETRVV
jgi:hypothetical protein